MIGTGERFDGAKIAQAELSSRADACLGGRKHMIVINRSVQITLRAQIFHRTLDLGHIDALEQPCDVGDMYTILMTLRFRCHDTHKSVLEGAPSPCIGPKRSEHSIQSMR